MRGKVLVTILVLTGCGALTSSAGGQISGDSVVGSGFVAGDQFEVSIHSGPSGENPTGFIRATGVVTFEGVPTCLRVSGNRASGGYRITSSPTLPIGSGFVAIVEDNGPLGSPQPDVLLRFGYPVTPPVQCPDPDVLEDPGSPFADLPFEAGDVTVIDRQPLPTSKDQCRDGGWRDFGVFENQGDCVSFVVTREKNPPGK